MPRIAYSEEDRERIRTALITVGLELMARQGIQHTTVEQVYKKVGISRTFFYSFFPTKEDLALETLYWQQPRIIEYVQKLMADPALKWRDAVKKFLHDCCYGEQNGIAVLTMEEQQLIFKLQPLFSGVFQNFLRGLNGFRTGVLHQLQKFRLKFALNIIDFFCLPLVDDVPRPL